MKNKRRIFIGGIGDFFLYWVFFIFDKNPYIKIPAPCWTLYGMHLNAVRKYFQVRLDAFLLKVASECGWYTIAFECDNIQNASEQDFILPKRS